jgi:hypothetical protein
MMRVYRHAMAGLAPLLLTASVAWADTSPAPTDQIDVGIFTAVEGKAVVTHPGIQKSVPVKLQDGVLFKDIIETEKESRTKALLNDDSILTVGEHSRVEVTEHIYDPNKGVRSVVVNLVKGQVRALVGKVFSGSGSKFEIHTPTAVAAARGTYFVVFHLNGVSGIVNVGTHGHVDFSSGGHTVNVPPGQFSVTPPGGGPPAPPAVNTGGNAPPQVTNAIHGTEVKDTPQEESPKQTAMASGGTAPVSSPSSLTPPGTSGGGGPSSTSGPSGPGGAGPQTPTTLALVPFTQADPENPVTPQPPPPPPPPNPPPPSPPGPTPPPPNPPPPNPPPPSPPPPPGAFDSIMKWFANAIDKLLDQFATAVAEAEKLETQKIAAAESSFAKAVEDAEQKEGKKVKNLVKGAENQISKVEQRYKDALSKIDDPVLRLQAQQAKDAEIAAIRAQLADGVGNARVERLQAIEFARITRAEALELAKINRAEYNLDKKVDRINGRLAVKLDKAGITDPALLALAEEARLKALADAEAAAKAALEKAVLDDIARKAAFQEEMIRKLQHEEIVRLQHEEIIRKAMEQEEIIKKTGGKK